MLHISLATLRQAGAVASLRNDDGDLMDVVRRNLERDPQKICCEAAEYLRELADAFETLADMPKPFNVVSQQAAMQMAAAKTSDIVSVAEAVATMLVDADAAEARSRAVTAEEIEWLDFEAAKQLPEGCTVLCRRSVGDTYVYEIDNYFMPGWLTSSDRALGYCGWALLEFPRELPNDPESGQELEVTKSIPPGMRRVELVLDDDDKDAVFDACDLFELTRGVHGAFSSRSNRKGMLLSEICRAWVAAQPKLWSRT